MPRKYHLNPVALSDERCLKTLVENRRVYTLKECELNLFETFKASELVPLTFNDLVVTSMVRGKKVMHLEDEPAFDYLPGETVLVPANMTMRIDFPEATWENPTQCIALALDKDKLSKITNRLNEDYPQEETPQYWQLKYDEYHFQNNLDLAYTINKLIDICSSPDTGKDILADLALKELVVRIIQSQNLEAIEKKEMPDETPLAFVLNFIRLNIDQQFHIQELSTKACMSVPTFYRMFKNELGISPLDYIQRERIKKAKQMLSDPMINITEISYSLGFTSLNYFGRQFKKIEGVTPGQYRQMVCRVG